MANPTEGTPFIERHGSLTSHLGAFASADPVDAKLAVVAFTSACRYEAGLGEFKAVKVEFTDRLLYRHTTANRWSNLGTSHDRAPFSEFGDAGYPVSNPQIRCPPHPTPV